MLISYSGYRVVEQLPKRPVFKVRNLDDMTKFCTLHCNMLFPLKMAQESDDQNVIVAKVNVQPLRANMLMEQHFSDVKLLCYIFEGRGVVVNVLSQKHLIIGIKIYMYG